MANLRWDETWRRLVNWTDGQGRSERLSAQLLLADGFSDLIPSHPLGGKDGGKDATCTKDDKTWVMGAYFPRGQQPFAEIKDKFTRDVKGARSNGADGFVFVTNQELRLAEREEIVQSTPDLRIELYHLERITALLDTKQLAGTRKQFLGIDFHETEASEQITQLREGMLATSKRLEDFQTGGDTFCYFMLYHFDLNLSIARNFVVIKNGEFPLFELQIRIVDMHLSKNLHTESLGEHNSPANFKVVEWPLLPVVYYRIFFHARNGSWSQDLILNRSEPAGCWLAATRVLGRNGRDIVFMHLDNEYELEFGLPEWLD